MVNKLKKLLALANDSRANDEERKSAFEKYRKLKEKYNLEITEEEKELFYIKCKNEYEIIILNRLLFAYEVDQTYTRNNHSKMKIYFKLTKTSFELMNEEFEYHKKILRAILTGVTDKYKFSQIKDAETRYVNKEEYEKLSEIEKIRIKASSNNFWLEEADFRKKIRIS